MPTKRQQRNGGIRNGKFNHKDVLISIQHSMTEMNGKMDLFDDNLKDMKQQQDVCAGEIRRLSLLIVGDPASTDDKKQLGVIGRVRDTEKWRCEVEQRQKTISARVWALIVGAGLYLVQLIVNFVIKLANGGVK